MADLATFPCQLVLLLGWVSLTAAGYMCTTTTDWADMTTTTIYCVYRCCGTYPSQYCCPMSTGLIFGIVFGCVAAACLVLVLGLVCCYLKKRGIIGRGVTYHNHPNDAVVCSGTTTTSLYNPNIGQPAAVPQPPPYAPPAEDAPPPYSYIDTSAYPPGTVAPDPFAQVLYKTN